MISLLSIVQVSRDTLSGNFFDYFIRSGNSILKSIKAFNNLEITDVVSVLHTLPTNFGFYVFYISTKHFLKTAKNSTLHQKSSSNNLSWVSCQNTKS